MAPELTFIVSKTIRSMAPMSPIICEIGDSVTVKGWYCEDGPTVIKVISKRYGNVKDHCIPFGWMVEAGMPPEMKKLIKML